MSAPNPEIKITMSGPIGESSPLFSQPIQDAKTILLDMTDVTYINSIGVKHWILWTLKIPKDCVVKMLNCPLVIVSQANTVVGFLTQNMFIDSFRMPYVCENCNHEESHLMQRGREYEYPKSGQRPVIKVNENLKCPKCAKNELQPDVLIEKTFKFLNPENSNANP